MRQTQVSARWTGEALTYVGVDSRGHEILMGGQHVSPAQMVLLGLAGCMGIDVLSILEKKRQRVSDVQIQVTAQQPDEYPRPYQVIDVIFVIKGERVEPQAVSRAIELSKEKYCVVGQTLQNQVEINTSFVIEA
jgi:putative redox protein